MIGLESVVSATGDANVTGLESVTSAGESSYFGSPIIQN